jgi:hypothetical protein
MAAFLFCRELGISEDTLRKCMMAVTDHQDQTLEPGVGLCVQEAELKKGVIYELCKFSSDYSLDVPGLMLLKILNKE